MLSVVQSVSFVSLLLIASATDIKCRIVPHKVCVLLALTGLIDFSPVRLWGLLLAAPFFIASMTDQGGAGDLYLVAAASFVVGFSKGVVALFVTTGLFVMFYGIHKALRHRQGKSGMPKSYPLAPFLAVGYITAYFIGG